jgi:hypothetical protein
MAEPTIQQIQQTQTTIPDYARPYVESMLGKANALTNINQNPYMQYMGDRVAQFNPLQQKSFQGAFGMQTAPQIGQATGIAQDAATRAGNINYGAPASYNAGTFGNQGVTTKSFDQSAADQYMNPYMQSVVDIQKREANRSAQQMASQNAAKFAGAGAFGGSRQAVAMAEADRNLGQQMGDIQATGSNQAWQQALQQFNADQGRTLNADLANQQANLSAQQMGEQSRQYGATLGEQSRQFGAGLGLQGLQTALQGANTLGQLGNNQYNQQMGILGLQNQFGGQQQQQTQNILNNQYQDFMNQQNHPYQQLSYMSNLLRGLPMSNTTSQMYQAPPSMLNQVAGAGFTAKALGAFAGGGSVDERPAGLADLAIYNMGQD